MFRCRSGPICGDHPRSRGEYNLLPKVPIPEGGSSPLSRGIRHVCPRRGRASGIIPALAGNTVASSSKPRRNPDHPRSRGEYGLRCAGRHRGRGSSPLSRGIHAPSTGLEVFQRIIPALAGNTSGRCLWPGGGQDHPRSRGEYVVVAGGGSDHDGSSPLSRGIPATRLGQCRREGIIPDLAGNTRAGSGDGPPPQDHPRSRGEFGPNRTFSWTYQDHPRSRGEFTGLRHLIGEIGDHPRSRGELLVDKGFHQPDLSDLGNPLLARLRFSKSLAPRLRRPPSWRGGSSGSASEGPGRTIRVSPS